MTRVHVATIATVLALVAPAVARADATDKCIASAENGQRLRHAARLRAAREELIACAGEGCPSAIARDCKRWLAEVESSLPSIVVRVLDGEGHDVTDAIVTVDGEPTGMKADGRARPIDPGEHGLTAERAGAAVRASIVVASGEHERLITLHLPDASASAPASGRRAAISPLTWVLGAAGLVAGAAGVFFWIDGRSDRARLFSTCGVSRTCTVDDKERAQTKLVVGDVLVASGVLALGAAVFVGIGSVRVATSPTASGGVLVGSGAF